MFGMGMTEMIFIFVAGLVLFGPRKLPEIGRTLGKAMAQFRNASNEFKRTWEQEVETVNRKTALAPPKPVIEDTSALGIQPPIDSSTADAAVSAQPAVDDWHDPSVEFPPVSDFAVARDSSPFTAYEPPRDHSESTDFEVAGSPAPQVAAVALKRHAAFEGFEG